MRWLIALLLIFPAAAGQVPQIAPVEQPHVTLSQDGLWLHFASVGQPILDAESPVVRYTLDGGQQQEVPAAQVGRLQTTSATGEASGTTIYAAHVEAGPGSVVVYSGGALTRGFTPEQTVAVPPADTLRFAAAGDIGYDGVAQDGTDDGSMPEGSPPIVIRDITLEHDPDLMLIPGDLAYDNSQLGWDKFMRMYAPLQSTVPTMAVIGNHEWMEGGIGYGQFLAEYVLPGDEHDYLFRAGPVTFVGINVDNICAGDTYRTNYGHEADPCPYGEPDTAKIERIEGLLREAQDDANPWTVVYFHQPAFSWGRHNSDFGVRTLLSPLFDRYGVDFAVTSHDHLYSRSYPVLADETVTQTGNEYVAGHGIVYIVLGGGGRELYDIRYPDEEPPAWYAEGGKFHHATIVDANATTMSVQVIAINGTVMDSFSIQQGELPRPSDQATPLPWVVAVLALVASQLARRR